MKILAMATCHNRKNKTIEALKALHSQSALNRVELDVVLLSDGCTDGTVEAVRAAYPEIHIIHGDGNLYWAGGMRAVWNYVKAENLDFDHLLVFNDDIDLYETALETLLEDHNFLSSDGNREIVVTGNFLNKAKKAVTYGGWVRSSRWHPLRMALDVSNLKLEKPTIVDTLNMNFSLINRSAIERNGFLADYFVHRGADFEFGLRVTRSGGIVASSSKVVGTCERNSDVGTSNEQRLSRLARLRRLLSPKEEPFLQRFHFYRYHGGPIWPVLFIAPYIKATLFRRS